MAVTIGKNIASITARAQLNRTSDLLSQAQARLVTGERITKPADDAAGLAVASALKSTSRLYTQSIRGLNDSVSFLQTSEGVVGQLINVVSRIKELATQSAQGTFSPSQHIAIQNESNALVAEYNRISQSASFNGQSIFGLDGISFATPGSSEVVTVSAAGTGNGTTNSGTFQAAISGGTDGGKDSPKLVADMNGDGCDDVVTTNGSVLWVNYGGASGISNTVMSSFVPSAFLQLSGAGSSATPDVNGDGNLDLVTLNDNTKRFMVGLGNGDGSFSALANASSANSQTLGTHFAFGDMNGDGRSDVVYGAYGDLYLRYGQSDGSFGAETLVAAKGSGSLDWAAPNLADFNNDGRVDIAARYGDGTLRLFTNNGAGSFSTSTVGTAPYFAYTTAVGDINNDGKKDLVIRSSDALYSYINNGSGGFSQSVVALGPSNSVSVKDLNGDGYGDVVTASSNGTTNFSIFYGSASGALSAATTVSAGVAQNCFGVGDINGDGANDLIGNSGGSLLIRLGDAQGTATIQNFEISTIQDARASLDDIDDLFQRLIKTRGLIGGSLERIGYALQGSDSAKLFTDASAGNISSTDMAADVASLTRLQILQQVGSSILAQANVSPKLALRLLGL